MSASLRHMLHPFERYPPADLMGKYLSSRYQKEIFCYTYDMPDAEAIETAEYVARCEPRPIGIRVPSPVDQALDALVDEAGSAGFNTSRAEVVCALIAQAAKRPTMIRAALGRYRKTRVIDLLGPISGAGLISLSKASKGRPATRSQRVDRWRLDRGTTIEETPRD